MVKKIFRYRPIFIRFDRIHERDGRTDGRTDTARYSSIACMHSIALQKLRCCRSI